jgi:iron complex transport system substrate-binding protein
MSPHRRAYSLTGSAINGVVLYAVLVATTCILSITSPSVKSTPVVTALPAERVVILPVVLSGYATINEGVRHIVAVSLAARRRASDGLLDHVYPALRRVPLSGITVTPDPEQILHLKPDIVFVDARDVHVLKNVGLPGLMEITWDSQNPVQSRNRMWKQMGGAAGKSGRAGTLMDRYSARIEVLRASPPTGCQPRVLYINLQNGSWFTTNGDYYIAYKLEMVGATNVSKDLKLTTRADLEQLLLLDPDIILFAAHTGDTATMQEVVRQHEFQSLRAVRERRIYKLPEHTYMNEPVEDPLLLTWMAEVFYPDVMPRRLREEYKETYREVYHYAISDDEIDKAIYLDENRYSAGYKRFMRKGSFQ